MKRKVQKATRPEPAEDVSNDWPKTKRAGGYRRYTKASLDDLAANIERGIRDLPVWKDNVRRLGLRAARAILRRGLVINQITDGNLRN